MDELLILIDVCLQQSAASLLACRDGQGVWIDDQAKDDYAAIGAARDSLSRIREIVDTLDRPSALLAIPQPERLRLSELLHGKNDTR